MYSFYSYFQLAFSVHFNVIFLHFCCAFVFISINKYMIIVLVNDNIESNVSKLVYMLTVCRMSHT